MTATATFPGLRRLLIRSGKHTLRKVGEFQARHSLVGTAPVLDNAEFAWVENLERHWRQIRTELDAVLARPQDIPAFHVLSPDQQRISHGDNWKTYAFYVFGHRVNDNCETCPFTAHLLDSLPNLQNAWYSILAPHYHIPPHRGPTRAVIRCHLALKVPADRERCWLRVDQQICYWREGRCLVFDDTYEHQVKNDTDEVRVVLFLDFDRPMDLPGRLFNRLLIGIIRASAYVRDPLRNLATWNDRVRAGASSGKPGGLIGPVLIDLRTAGPGVNLDADVCVVGAGAAGISISRRLSRAGHRVCLLEAGGLDYDAETQSLYAGESLGMSYYDLVDARLRFFGGTTNIWGGRCTPLEPGDFEVRPWVPYSGWPLTYDDLLPYYHAAHEDLGLGEYAYDERLWSLLGKTPPALSPELMVTRFWRFDVVKERFNAARCQDLLQADDVRVAIHANVVHLQANSHASALQHIRVRTLEGRELAVRAKAFVLACGGIENARLLLAANDVERPGIGNGRGLVGRFFMEHPHGRAGQVRIDRPHRLWDLFRKRAPGNGQPPIAPTLLPALALQERAGILNTAMTFKLQRDPQRGMLLNDRIYRRLKHQLPPDRTRRRLWHAYRDARGLLQRTVKPVLERARSTGSRNLYLMVRAEQAPNPDSRITLGPERDALGMPRAALNWQLSRQDKDTLAVLATTLDAEFSRLGLGGVEKSRWIDEPGNAWPVDATVSKHPIAGYHHMGTTRMSRDPASGVVDEQCRVHGYHNLYVAGSSVFPTSGWANPTLTILALAYRLADELGRRL